MKITNKEAFALAVVSSSDPKLSIEEKITLYFEALEKSKQYNKEQPTPKGTMKVWKG